MKPTAWAIKIPWWGHPPSAIWPDRAWPRRVEAHEFLGSAWAKDGETPMQGWRHAYRKGFRVVRCAVVEAAE